MVRTFEFADESPRLVEEIQGSAQTNGHSVAVFGKQGNLILDGDQLIVSGRLPIYFEHFGHDQLSCQILGANISVFQKIRDFLLFCRESAIINAP